MLVNIEAERSRKQMTKEQISKALGVTPKTYSSYINGSPIPSNIILAMAEMFDCSTDYLLGLTDQKKITA